MRSPDRIDNILRKLGDLWKRVPDWRLGQLFNNVQKAEDDDLFYYEDDDLIDIIEDFLNTGVE